MPHEHRVRFDVESEHFDQVASELRAAIEAADRLWRRLNRAEAKGDFSKAKRIGRKLEAADARVEAAHEKLQEHTRHTLRKPFRERARPVVVRVPAARQVG